MERLSGEPPKYRMVPSGKRNKKYFPLKNTLPPTISPSPFSTASENNDHNSTFTDSNSVDDHDDDYDDDNSTFTNSNSVDDPDNDYDDDNSIFTDFDFVDDPDDEL